MVTLKDIAGRCGLSIATVSKALNNLPDIAPATLKRVQDTAREMGYMPNAAARSMKTGRSMIIGLLWFYMTGSFWQDEYFTGVASGIQSVADEAGYDITPVNCNGGNLMGGWLNYCRYRNYDGLIVMSGAISPETIRELMSSDIPSVTIDCRFENRSSVTTDNEECLARLVRYAYGMGHRRPAYIIGEPCMVTEDRLNGFKKTWSLLGTDVPPEYIRQAHFHNVRTCSREAEALMRLPQPPDCIFCPDDQAAIGVIRHLGSIGCRVPDDISVIGFDGIRLAGTVTPSLTTVRQDCAAIGREATKLLLQRIRSEEPSAPVHIRIPGKVVEGTSLCARPAGNGYAK